MNWKLILDLTAAYPSYGMEVQEVQAHELVFFLVLCPCSPRYDPSFHGGRAFSGSGECFRRGGGTGCSNEHLMWMDVGAGDCLREITAALS